MYDKEFAEAFKEEIELTEMKWEVGGVYHQEFKNGDKVYFKAGSVQKNKRWKGLSVDEFGGRQKKAKSASADEKQQGWETTPKNEIPKGLKEEVEIDEAGDKKWHWYNLDRGVYKLEKNNKGMVVGKMHDRKKEVKDGFPNADEVLSNTKQAAKFVARKNGMPLHTTKEEVEIDEGKFKKGDIVIPNMGPHKGEKHKIIHDFGDGSYNITPQKHSRFIKYKQGAAKAKENQLKLVKEEVEEASTYRDRAKDDEKKKKKHFAFGGKKKSRHGESGYGKGEEVEVDEAKGFWAVIDTAKKGEVMAVSTDEKDAYNSIKNSTTSKYDYHYGKDPKTLKVVKVMGSHNQKKAERMIGTKLSYRKEEVEATRMPMQAPFKLEEEIFYWYIIRGDLANGKIVYAGNEKQAKLKRHDPKFGDGHVMTKSRKMKKVGDKWKKSEGVSEEIEIDEKKSHTGYELYHKDFSSAMQHAYKFAKSKGHVIDPKEIDDKVATGPKKPSSGKTNRYSLKAGRKRVEIQVANLDNKRYELNMYIESENTASTHPLEVRRKKYVELNKKDAKNPFNKIKEALTRIRSLVEKPEEVELEEIPSPNQAAIDAFLKKGGKINDPKYAPVLKKRKKINVAAFQKSFANTKQKEKDADKKAKRRYVSGGGKQDGNDPLITVGSDYVTHKDIKKFPSSLTSGLKKIISGAKMQKYEIKTKKSGKISGMGITFPGSTTPKLMIQFDEDTSVRKPNPQWSEKGIDPKTHRKFQMTVWINEAPTAKGKISDKIDWYERKAFDGKTADVVAKRTLQYLKTKVKRLANEEVEIDEVLVMGKPPKSMKPEEKLKWFDKLKSGQTVKLWYDSTMARGTKWREFKVGRKTKSAKYNLEKISMQMMKDGKAGGVKWYLYNRQGKISMAWGDMGVTLISMSEGIDIEKASMGAVIKDFQDSDAPQFKGKSDKKRKEMAIAAKLSKEEKEETDDPKSKKKDKINLKPKMDETMKNYKEFMKKVKEDTDPDTKGTQGDNAEWKKARSAVLKKYGVASCAFIKDDKTKKQCFKDLDDSHVADHEEQVKKEEVKVDKKIKENKDVISKILGRRKEVKEAVSTGGIEYGEQDWDVGYRLDHIAPYLDQNFAEFHEQGLEGPYLWHGETYFFDRKVGSWYSVTAEDFVDDEISKDLSLAYVKDGMYKRQFAS